MNAFDRDLGKERFAGAAKLQREPGVWERSPSVSRWPVCLPFQAPGGEMAGLSARERGGPSSCPQQGEACPRLRAKEAPELGVMGRRAARATGGTPGWLGGTAPDRTGCGQLRLLAVAATWPARCGCHLTPGAQP